MDFGNKLKKLRKEKNFSQEDLAKKIGVTRSSVANYETNRNYPNNEVLQKISVELDVSLDYLLNSTAIKNPKDSLESDLKKLNLTKYELEQAIDIYKSFVTNGTLPSSVDLTDFSNNITRAFNTIYCYAYDYFSYKSYDWDSRDYPSPDEFLKAIENKSNLEVLNLVNSLDLDKIVVTNVVSTTYLYNIPIIGKIAAGQPILAEEYLEGYLPVDPDVYGMTSSDDYFYLRVSGESMNKKVHNGDYALIHKQDYAENGDIIVAIVNGDDEATLKRYKVLNEQFILLEPMSTDPSFEPITIDLNRTNFQIIGKAIGQFGKF